MNDQGEAQIPAVYYQPQFPNDQNPVDIHGEERYSFEVWESKEQCQIMFPNSVIEEYSGSQIEFPTVYFADGTEAAFEEYPITNEC